MNDGRTLERHPKIFLLYFFTKISDKTVEMINKTVKMMIKLMIKDSFNVTMEMVPVATKPNAPIIKDSPIDNPNRFRSSSLTLFRWYSCRRLMKPQQSKTETVIKRTPVVNKMMPNANMLSRFS